MPTDTPSPQIVDVAMLPTLDDYDYVGGRDSFHAFCTRVFTPGGPRFLQGPDGALAVFRHADVRALGAAPNMSVLAPSVLFPGLLDGPEPATDRLGYQTAYLLKNQLFTANPPLNPELRRVMLTQVGPKPMELIANQTRELAIEVLEALPQGVSVDFVKQVAEPLVGRFWGARLGMTDADAIAAAEAARQMSPMLFLKKDLASVAAVDTAAKTYRKLVEGAGDKALATGGCPFVEGIVKDLAKIDIADDLDYGGFVPKTAGAFLAGNLFDGFHTAVLAVANTLYVLLHRPEAFEELRRAPERAKLAVAECLRLEPPVIQLNRITTGEVRYDDLIIPKNVPVIVMWGVANHDPAAFPRPDTFDPDRSQQGATTFGGGAHICPGRFAALLMARSLLEALVEAEMDFSPAPEREQWIKGSAMCQLERLPVIAKRL